MLFTAWMWCAPAAFDCCCPLQHGKETQLLHVFEEHLILGSENRESAPETPTSPQIGIKVLHKSCIMFLRECNANEQQHFFLLFSFLAFHSLRRNDLLGSFLPGGDRSDPGRALTPPHVAPPSRRSARHHGSVLKTKCLPQNVGGDEISWHECPGSTT